MNECLTTTNRNIDVVVLCGGKGTRLQAVVNDRPKPMAMFGDKPFLYLLLDYMSAQGFMRFILCAGYKADMIESYFLPSRSQVADRRPDDSNGTGTSEFAGCNSFFVGPLLAKAGKKKRGIAHAQALQEEKQQARDYEVTVYREETLLGTAGALCLVAGSIKGDNVLVMNGDSFCAVNYENVIQAHVSSCADATMVVTKVENRDDFGNVILDKDGRITSFREKQSNSSKGYVNAGIYLFKRSVIESLEKRTPMSLERDVFPGLINSRFFAYIAKSVLLDIGTPDRYVRAKKLLVNEMRKDIATL